MFKISVFFYEKVCLVFSYGISLFVLVNGSFRVIAVVVEMNKFVFQDFFGRALSCTVQIMHLYLLTTSTNSFGLLVYRRISFQHLCVVHQLQPPPPSLTAICFFCVFLFSYVGNNDSIIAYNRHVGKIQSPITTLDCSYFINST